MKWNTSLLAQEMVVQSTPCDSGYRRAEIDQDWLQRERDRSCGPRSWPLVTTGSWVSRVLECFGGKVTVQNTVAPPPWLFSRSTLEGFTIQLCLPKKCVPYSIFTARLLTRTSSSISTAQLCLGTPTWRVLKLQTSCVTWPLPEGVYSPAALRGPFPRVPSEQSSCLIYDLA